MFHVKHSSQIRYRPNTVNSTSHPQCVVSRETIFIIVYQSVSRETNMFQKRTNQESIKRLSAHAPPAITKAATHTCHNFLQDVTRQTSPSVTFLAENIDQYRRMTPVCSARHKRSERSSQKSFVRKIPLNQDESLKNAISDMEIIFLQ
jgi:hypothetical protein